MELTKNFVSFTAFVTTKPTMFHNRTADLQRILQPVSDRRTARNPRHGTPPSRSTERLIRRQQGSHLLQVRENFTAHSPA